MRSYKYFLVVIVSFLLSAKNSFAAITFNANTTGVTTQTSLFNGQTGVVMYGISATKTDNGAATVANAVLRFTTNSSNPLGYLSNIRLYKSTTLGGGFSTADEVTGINFNQSGNDVIINTNTTLTWSSFLSNINFFVVADITQSSGTSVSLTFNLSEIFSYFPTTSITNGTTTTKSYTLKLADITATGYNTAANGITQGSISYGQTGIVLFGFSLTGQGSLTVSSLNIGANRDVNPFFAAATGTLYRSTTQNFSDAAPIATSSVTYPGSYAHITGLSEVFNATTPTTYYYFLVGDFTANNTYTTGTNWVKFNFSASQSPAVVNGTLNQPVTSDGTAFTVIATYDWKGGTSANFNDMTNFKTITNNAVGSLPGTSVAVRIGSVPYATAPVVSAGTPSIGQLIFGSVQANPTLTINSGRTLTVNGNTVINTGSTPTITGAGTFTTPNSAVAHGLITSPGSTTTLSATVFTLDGAGGTVINGGTINVTGGTFTTDGTVANNGTINQSGTSALTFSSTLINDGLFNKTSTGTATFSGAVTNKANASFILGSGVATFATTLTNNTDGNITFGNGTYTITGVFNNAGGLTGGCTGTYDFNGAATFTNSGTITLSGATTKIAATAFNNTATGVFTATGGSTLFDNVGVQSINNANTTTPVTFYNMILNSTGNQTKTLNGTAGNNGKFAIASTGSIEITGSTTDLAAGTAILTLRSDVNGSATVKKLLSANTITGTINVERFVTGNNSITYRGYRLMSSPVNTSGITSLNYLAANTIITGAQSTYGTVAGNPTIYLYNESLAVNNASFVSGNFVGVKNITTTTLGTLSGSTSATTTLPTGNGFFLYFRGDKTTNVANKTVAPFAPADDVTFTATGTLNQGTIVVNNWFHTNLSNLNASAAAKGYNLVGNPYASAIDWDKYLTGDNSGTSTTSAIPHKGISKTIYIYNPTKRGYSVYIAGNLGVATNADLTTTPSANLISSGQGFFVKATPAAVNPTLSFTEDAKAASQVSGLNLMLSTEPIAAAPVLQYLRIQVLKDQLNTEDALIFFKKDAKPEYVEDEDASYLKGNTIVNISTQSSDKVALAINQIALPTTKQAKIDLNVTVTSNGIYQLNMPEIKNIPQLYDVWLMDALKKDSLDIKHNPTYNFNATTADAATFSKRFSLVIRQNAAYAYRLLDFNAVKNAGTVQLNWKTENEENYTYFTVERSTDGGKTFDILGSEKAVSQNTYSILDKTPVVGENLYRLKQEDMNGVITYSKVVPVMFSLFSNTHVVASNISVYPNPASSTLNLVVTKKTTDAANYNISVTNSTGRVIKTIVASQPDWHGDVSSLLPGTYFVQVINAIDKSMVGKTTFVKL